MSEYTSDTGGIISLSGFAYQIRVFVYFMLQMEENESIGFETFDDVAVGRVTTANIDSLEGKFKSTMYTAKGINRFK